MLQPHTEQFTSITETSSNDSRSSSCRCVVFLTCFSKEIGEPVTGRMHVYTAIMNIYWNLKLINLNANAQSFQHDGLKRTYMRFLSEAHRITDNNRKGRGDSRATSKQIRELMKVDVLTDVVTVSRSSLENTKKNMQESVDVPNMLELVIKTHTHFSPMKRLNFSSVFGWFELPELGLVR
ncbi:hypothetical protein M8C21_032627, partial [Ambrosia artemisiifolia]